MQRDKDELFERLQRVEGGAAERERELHRLRQENLALKQELEESNKVQCPYSASTGDLSFPTLFSSLLLLSRKCTEIESPCGPVALPVSVCGSLHAFQPHPT